MMTEIKNTPAGSLGFLRNLVSRPVEFVIETELSDVEVIERLRAIVEPRSSIVAPLVPTNKLFAGKVSAQGFQMMRIIGYGNGALPVIIGYFEPGPKGERVRVTMRLTRVASFSRLLFLPILVVVLACSSIAVWKQNGATVSLLNVAICVAVVWAIATTDSYEERKARTLLEETLQTTPSMRIQAILSGTAPRRIRGIVFMLGLGLIVYWLISQIVAAIFLRH